MLGEYKLHLFPSYLPCEISSRKSFHESISISIQLYRLLNSSNPSRYVEQSTNNDPWIHYNFGLFVLDVGCRGWLSWLHRGTRLLNCFPLIQIRSFYGFYLLVCDPPGPLSHKVFDLFVWSLQYFQSYCNIRCSPCRRDKGPDYPCRSNDRTKCNCSYRRI